MALTEKNSRRLSSKSTKLFADLPPMPPTLLGVEGAQEWNSKLQEFWGRFKQALGEGFLDGDKRTTRIATSFASADAVLTALIEEEKTVRATADAAEAGFRIAADASLQGNIDTVSASVVAEASARATADGNLSGKYTLTVAAGNVVTGMNITSTSGPGTTVSEVAFQADRFKIYNGTTGIIMFDVDSSKVRLGAVLTVDTPNTKVYIGAGNFANADTAFYVDATGKFSLKDKLSWDGSALAIDGTLRGGATTFGAGTGFWMGLDGGVYKFRVGDPAGARIEWDGSNFSVFGLSTAPLSAALTTINLFKSGANGASLFTSECGIIPSGGSGTGYTFAWTRTSGSSDISATDPTDRFTTFNCGSGTDEVKSAYFKGTVTDSESNVVDTIDNVYVEFIYGTPP